VATVEMYQARNMNAASMMRTPRIAIPPAQRSSVCRDLSQSLRESPAYLKPSHLTTSGQAQCHMRELRSNAGLAESGRNAESRSEKTLTPPSRRVAVHLCPGRAVLNAMVDVRTIGSRGGPYRSPIASRDVDRPTGVIRLRPERSKNKDGRVLMLSEPLKNLIDRRWKGRVSRMPVRVPPPGAADLQLAEASVDFRSPEASTSPRRRLPAPATAPRARAPALRTATWPARGPAAAGRREPSASRPSRRHRDRCGTGVRVPVSAICYCFPDVLGLDRPRLRAAAVH
jgi:hypothetical protein